MSEQAVATRAAVARRRETAPPAALDDRLFIACGLAWAAGLIHVQAAIQHLDESTLYAAFFAVLAPVQFVWGIALYRWRGAAILRAGAIASVAVAGLWLASRTTGLPIGPEPWHPEAVGATDVIATADEIVLALIALIHRHRDGGGFAAGVRWVISAVGMILILLSSLAVVLPGHVH